MKNRVRLPAAAAALLLAAACGGSTMSVRMLQTSYTPAMSSTPGIGLTPVFVAPRGASHRYHWHANFGTFVSWEPPAYRVVPRGDDAGSGGETMYWTYDPRFAFNKKPTVEITVEAIDEATGRVLADKTIVLDWDGDAARVRD